MQCNVYYILQKMQVKSKKWLLVFAQKKRKSTCCYCFNLYVLLLQCFTSEINSKKLPKVSPCLFLLQKCLKHVLHWQRRPNYGAHLSLRKVYLTIVLGLSYTARQSRNKYFAPSDVTQRTSISVSPNVHSFNF